MSSRRPPSLEEIPKLVHHRLDRLQNPLQSQGSQDRRQKEQKGQPVQRVRYGLRQRDLLLIFQAGFAAEALIEPGGTQQPLNDESQHGTDNPGSEK